MSKAPDPAATLVADADTTLADPAVVVDVEPEVELPLETNAAPEASPAGVSEDFIADDIGFAETEDARIVAASFPSNRFDAAVNELLSEVQDERLQEFVRARFEDFRVQLASPVATPEDTLPDEHQPGERMPVRRSSPAAPAAAAATPGSGLEWTATLCLEGQATEDGRAFAPDSVSWRDLPLTLMAMIETADGHDGAQVAGRIDRIWREGALVKGAGVFDAGEYGQDIARMVSDGTLRGVSVDIAVLEYEVGPYSDWFSEDGAWQPREKAADEAEPDLFDLLADEHVVMVVTDGRIGAATVCPFPAFADASIALSASLVSAAMRSNPMIWTSRQQAAWTVVERQGLDVPVTAAPAITAAAAGLAPLAPPAEWFTDPGLSELTPLTIDEHGRIFGHAWAWDSCHIGIPDACTTAPHSNTNYSYFHLGEIVCEDGERLAVGKLTLGTGHADRRAGPHAAASHYDNTGSTVAYVMCGEDAYGGWVAGCVRSNADAEAVRDLRAAVLSGDWRDVNGNLELVALLAVNVPGFPVPRPRAVVASGKVISLTATGIPSEEVEKHLSESDLERLQALRDRAGGDRFAGLRARLGS